MTNVPVEPTFTEKIRELLRRVEFRRIKTTHDLEAVFRLRYAAYLREGAITPRDDGKLTDRLDEAENGTIFGLYIDGTLAGSIRLHIVNLKCSISPALEAFPDHLQQYVDAGYTIIDPNRFVADADASLKFQELPYVILRLPYMAAAHFNADYVTATVRSEHQAFYRRVFRAKPIAAPRLYPTLIKPLTLMIVDFPRERRPIVDRYPIFLSDPQEREKIFGECQELFTIGSLQ